MTREATVQSWRTAAASHDGKYQLQLVATWLRAAAKRSIHRLWRGATCYGAAALCAKRILFAYEFTVSVFYVLQIILIVVLLKCKVDPCPDKSRFDFWPSAISIFDPWLLSWPRTKIAVQNILECHPLEVLQQAISLWMYGRRSGSSIVELRVVALANV